MNLQVSIIIVFYDNDWTLIPTLLKHIRERIKITHEVILIDNREKFKDKKLSLRLMKKFIQLAIMLINLKAGGFQLNL